jgi:ribosome-binding factor A
MSTIRQQKVEQLLKKELAVILQAESREHFSGTMVTVTLVRISPDLGYAKVYLSFFPASKRDETIKTIENLASRLRWLLGNKVGKQLRIVPELSFRVDDSLDYAQNIDDLLNKK